MAGTYKVGDNTKAAILKGSRKLFYKKGYKNTTYNDLSANLNINRALIPYHFNNKTALGVSVYNDIITTVMNAVDELIDTDGLSEDLSAAFHMMIYYRLFNNRHFVDLICDLANENSDMLFDKAQEGIIINKLSEAYSSYNGNEFDVICKCMAAIRLSLIKALKEESCSPDKAAIHYINYALRYVGVSQSDIDDLIDSAMQLCDLINCEIRQGFSVSVSYR